MTTDHQGQHGQHVADVSASAMFAEVNGFDEIAINQQFGSPVHELREQPFMFLRAMGFVHQRRAGLKDREAYKAVMELGTDAVLAYFPPEPPEVGGEDTEEGKEPPG